MRLAVCAEMVFLDLPVHRTGRRIADPASTLEIWDWTRHDLRGPGRYRGAFSSMTGYSGATDRPDGADELIRTAEQSIAAAETLGCPG